MVKRFKDWVSFFVLSVVLINSLSSVYFKAGELSSFAIVNEYTLALLMAFDDFDDQDFIWGESEPFNAYDAKIYDNQYDDSHKIPYIPALNVYSIDVIKALSEQITSKPFIVHDYRPPPPNPPPV